MPTADRTRSRLFGGSRYVEARKWSANSSDLTCHPTDAGHRRRTAPREADRKRLVDLLRPKRSLRLLTDRATLK